MRHNCILWSVGIITESNRLKGIRTIALRLTGTKEAEEELKELGEDTENVITTQSKLRDVVMEATKVASNGYKGFDILNDNGSYKSTYEIMLGIAEVWDEIKETDAKFGTKKSNLLLENIAGKNRANIAASILESPELLKEAFDYSAEASGSAMKENEKYLDSLSGKLAQLQTEWQKLSSTAIESDFLKALVDMGTTGLSSVTAITEGISGLGIAFSGIMGILGANGAGFVNIGKTGKINSPFFDWIGVTGRKPKFDLSLGRNNDFMEGIKDAWSSDTIDFEGIANGIGDVDDKLVEAAASAKTAGKSFVDFNTDVTKLQSGASEAAFSLKNLGLTALNIGTNMLVSMGISALANFVFDYADHIIHAREYIEEAMESAQTNIDNATANFDSQEKSIVSLRQRYAELSEGVKVTSSEIKNMSLSDTEFEEYLNLNNQLKDLAPELVSGWDSQGNALINLGSSYTEVTGNIDEYIEKLREVRNLEVADNMEDLFAGTVANVQDIQKEVEAAEEGQKVLNGAIKKFDNNEELKNNVETLLQTGRLSGLTTEQAQMYKKILDQMGVQSGYESSGLFDDVSYGLRVAPIDENEIESTKERIDNAVDSVIGEYQTKIGEFQKTIAESPEKQKAQWQSISDEMLMSLQTTDAYKNLKMQGEEAVNVFQSAFNNLDFGKIVEESEYDRDTTEKWFTDNLIIPMQNVAPEFSGLFSLQEQFDENLITAKEYSDKLIEVLNSESFKTLAPEVQDALSKAFTYTSKDDKNIDQMFSIVRGKLQRGVRGLGDTTTDLNDFMSSLTKDDLELIVQIIEEGTPADEILSKWQELKNAAKDEVDLEARTNLEDYTNAKSEKGYLSDYESYRTMLEEAKQLYDEDRVGSKQFEAAAKALSVNGMTDAINFEENYGQLSKYFTEDARDGLSLFLQDLEKVGAATSEITDNGITEWKLDLEDMEQTANDLYMPFEMLNVLLSGLNEYDFVQDYFSNAEDGAETVAELSKQLAEEQAKLTEMQNNPNLVDGNGNVIQAQTDLVNEYIERLDTAKEHLNQLVEASKEDLLKNREKAEGLASAYSEQLASTDKYDKDGNISEEYEYLRDEFLGRMQQLATQYSITVPVDFQLNNEDVQAQINKSGQYELNVTVNDAKDLEDAEKTWEEIPEEERKDMIVNYKVENPELLNDVNKQKDKFGVNGTVDVVDKATPKLKHLSKMEEAYGQKKITTEINAEDNASDKLEEVSNKSDEVDGKTATVTVDAEDNASSTLEQTKKYAESYGGTVTETHNTNFTETGADNVVNKANEVSAASDNTDKEHTTTFNEKGADNVSSQAKQAASDADKVDGTRTAILNAVNNVTSAVSSAESSLNKIDGKKVHTYIITHKSTTGGGGSSAPKGATDLATGTTGFISSHADGTVLGGMRAYFGGHNIALSEDQKALVGEEGMEGLVRDGQFYLIGKDSPEITDLKKGDIIFSAKQTKAILNGQKTGRGRTIGMASHAEGTTAPLSKDYLMAFAQGLLPAYRGGGGGHGTINNPSSNKSSSSSTVINNNIKQYNDYSGSSDNSGSSKKSKGKGGKNDKGKSGIEKALETLQKFTEKFFDWVEVKLDRQSKKIDNYITKAENAMNDRRYGSSAKNYNRAINATVSLIDYEGQGEAKYRAHAAKVLKKATKTTYKKKGKKVPLINEKLAKQLPNLVENGTIDISKYSKEVQTVIEEYKGWIDKALECSDAVEGLHGNINEYVKSLKEMRDAQRDAKIDKRSMINDVATSFFAFTNRSKNSQLGASNTTLKINNKAYNAEIKGFNSDVNRIGRSSNKAVTSNIKTTTKAINKTSNKKNKIAYTKYAFVLKQVQRDIKSKKKINNDVLSIIRKHNPVLYENIYAYNTALDELEAAKLEQAVNLATNTAQKYENISQRYDNKTEAKNDRISLLQQKSNNANSVKNQNKYLGKTVTQYNGIVATDEKELARYQKDVTSNRKAISKKKGSTRKLNTASDKTAKAVNKIINQAKAAAKSGKAISAGVLGKLADYYSRGYVSYNFYNSCLNYNNALEYKEQTKNQLEIDKQTAKEQMYSISNQKLSNIQQRFEDKANVRSSNADYSKNQIDLIRRLGESYSSTKGSELDGRSYYTGTTRKDASGKSYKVSLIAEYQNAIKETEGSLKVYEKGLKDLQKEYDKLRASGKLNTEDTLKWEATINQTKSSIIQYKEEIIDLKKELADYKLESFYKQIDTTNYTIKEFEDILGHFNMNNLFDDKGGIIKHGQAYIATIGTLIDQNTRKIYDYQIRFKELEKMYKRGEISQEEYTETLRQWQDEIRSSANNVENLKDKIVDLYINQMSKANSALKENIDLRKKSLARLKEYESYARTIRDKNKNINSIQAQINSLSGVSTQEGKAELARLRAQLKEAQEELADTQQDHRFDLIEQGYGDLSDDLTKAYDKMVEAIRKSTEEQGIIVNEMLTGINGSYKNIKEELEKIVEDNKLSLSENTENIIEKIKSHVDTTDAKRKEEEKAEKAKTDAAIAKLEKEIADAKKAADKAAELQRIAEEEAKADQAKKAAIKAQEEAEKKKADEAKKKAQEEEKKKADEAKKQEEKYNKAKAEVEAQSNALARYQAEANKLSSKVSTNLNASDKLKYMTELNEVNKKIAQTQNALDKARTELASLSNTTLAKSVENTTNTSDTKKTTTAAASTANKITGAASTAVPTAAASTAKKTTGAASTASPTAAMATALTNKPNTTAKNVHGKNIWIRKTASTTGEQLVKMPPDAKGELVLSNNKYVTKNAEGIKWIKIKYKGKTGWTRNSFLKYAKGAKRIDEDQIGITQDAGSEIIMSRGRMLVPTQLYKGDTVYPNDITEQLWDIGKLGLDGIKEQIEKDLQVKMPLIGATNSKTENNFGDYNITVNALQKLDKKEIEQLSDYFYDAWYKRMKKDLAVSGKKIR